jgi:hypothetical protein
METYFDKKLHHIFEENNLDEELVQHFPIDSRDKIVYHCSCGNLLEKSTRTFRTKPLCIECVPNNKTGKKSPDLQSFMDMLAEEGYSIVDPENCGYINTKSLVKIRGLEGQISETSYNRYHQGHRPKYLKNDNEKIALEEVKRRVSESNFSWIKGTHYVNNHTPFDVKCNKCDSTTKISLQGISKNTVGCNNCYHYNRKYDWKYVEGIADKYHCTIITDSKNYCGRDTIVEAICWCGEDMMKNVRCFMKTPRCKHCYKACREKTNEERYGAKNYFASDIGKETIKNYYLEKFGVSHPMKIPENWKKAQETCFKNFGVKCVLSTPEVRTLAVEAHIRNNGDRPGCVPAITDKMVKTMLERYGAKCFLASNIGHNCMIALCGNKHFLQSKMGREIMIERYGFPHAMQNADLFDQAQKTGFSTKSFILSSGKTLQTQGYENYCLRYLIDEEGVSEENIVTGAKNVPKVIYNFEGKNCRYYMDIYVVDEDWAIEVKSVYTYLKDKERNLAKWKACSKLCSYMTIHIFDKKGKPMLRQSMMNGKLRTNKWFCNIDPSIGEKGIFG